MKKQLLLLVVCVCFSTLAFGQTKFGGGVTFIDDFGIQARANLGVGEKLGLVPSFSYYFVESGLTAYSIDANLTYDVAVIGEGMPLYALAGLDWTNVSASGFGSNSEIGINVGAGIEVNENIYIEAFWRSLFCDFCGSNFGFNAGYYF